MNIKRFLVRIFFGAALSTALPAATIKMINADKSMPLWIDVDSVSEGWNVGLFAISIDGSSTLTDVLCVDKFHPINFTKTYNMNALAPNVIPNGERVSWIMHTYLPEIQSASGDEQKQLSAALALSAWDVIHDNGDGFSAGRIQESHKAGSATDTTVKALAESFLTASLGHTYSGATVLRDSVNGTNTQQLMFDDTASVPEPSTWAMCLAGMALVGSRLLKRS